MGDSKVTPIRTGVVTQGDGRSFNIPDGWALVPVQASLAMLEQGFEISGTKISSMQPNPKKIEKAQRCWERMVAMAAYARHYSFGGDYPSVARFPITREE